MSRTKQIKGECQHCGGHLEFPAEGIGLTATCPHCGNETELQLATPKHEPLVRTRTWIYLALTILIAVGGVGAVIIKLKHEERILAKKNEAQARLSATPTNLPPTPAQLAAKIGFRISTIKLEKTTNSTLVYAVGTVKNEAAKKKFGVKVELDLFDIGGNQISTTSDYQPVLEPKAEWRFKAIVVDSKAVSAKLASIKEDQ